MPQSADHTFTLILLAAAFISTFPLSRVSALSRAPGEQAAVLHLSPLLAGD